MITVILQGWEDGLEKVSLTKLQMEVLGQSLKESKENVDKLLDGEIVEIFVEELDKAKMFVLKASAVGAICKYES